MPSIINSIVTSLSWPSDYIHLFLSVQLIQMFSCEFKKSTFYCTFLTFFPLSDSNCFCHFLTLCLSIAISPSCRITLKFVFKFLNFLQSELSTRLYFILKFIYNASFQHTHIHVKPLLSFSFFLLFSCQCSLKCNSFSLSHMAKSLILLTTC